MKVIGITGGVGSGKSLVLKYAAKELGAVVIEADKVAYNLQKPGTVCYNAIVSAFGTDIVQEDGALDRGALAEIVFADEKRRKELNQIVHPFVKKEIIAKIDAIRSSQKTEFVFLEAALLIEEQYDAVCDEIWYIYAECGLRKQRLMHSRGYTEEKAARIMASQLGEEEFRRACSVVIDNNGSAEQTYQQIREELACQNR